MESWLLNLNNKNLKYHIFAWFAINTVIGILFAFLLSFGLQSSFPETLLFSQTATHTISWLNVITGYTLICILQERAKLRIMAVIVLAGVLLASITGVYVAIVISRELLNSSLITAIEDSIYPYLTAVFLDSIIIIISIIAVRMRLQKRQLEDSLQLLKNRDNSEKSNDKIKSGVSIKEGTNHYFIEHSEIIYLSSHGKKTLIHTENKEYETLQLIKEMEKKLPPEDFIRVHRQFIVNINYISNIKYFTGGRYIAYLNDEDENSIPVSRTLAPELKKKLSL